MIEKNLYLSNFQSIRPSYEVPQKVLIDWLKKAHLKADSGISSEELEVRFKKIEPGISQIETRGLSILDWSHLDWEKMDIYALGQKRTGFGMERRTEIFEAVSDQILSSFYPEEKELPEHIIQVSCTGYITPSSAQKIVSLRNAGHKTEVTHAFHMGCYASIPAIRMGMGFTLLHPKNRVDIVHTEVCSLHMHPKDHSIQQLVIQSLFADGFIKYSVQAEKIKPSLQIIAYHEEIIPHSLEHMDWRCGDHGMVMILSREVPSLIMKEIQGFLKRLLKKAHFEEKEEKILFAIHPGGPKIISKLASVLNLKEHQYKHSLAVQKRFGNMSSATLPHIWNEMLHDEEVKEGTYVISLAFGAGLTISGALLKI